MKMFPIFILRCFLNRRGILNIKKSPPTRSRDFTVTRRFLFWSFSILQYSINFYQIIGRSAATEGVLFHMEKIEIHILVESN